MILSAENLAFSYGERTLFEGVTFNVEEGDKYGIIGVSGKMLKEHPEMVKKYLAVHQQNIDFMNKETEKAYGFTAQETGLTIDEVKAMAPWYDFTTKITDADIKDLEATQDFLLKMGMQKNKIKIKDIIAEVK